MRKILLIGLTGILSGLTLSASPVTAGQALKRLSETASTRSVRFSDLKHVCSFRLPDGEPGVYVFAGAPGEGYMLLSADDVAAPLLGYSETGDFDENSLSPSMKWWIEEYGRQIEYARKNGAESYRKGATRSGKSPVAPMLKTEWNQNAPYSDLTPVGDDKGNHCVTGCVATAMAQVMKYWNYPETGQGVGECTVSFRNGTQTTDRMLLNERNFDWGNMLDVYNATSTPEQNTAVAYLMKACGYSVGMNYSVESSGAPTLHLASALINNFRYNENIQYCQRNFYTASDWGDMVYEELAAGRPVVYGGQSIKVGHCFVCDGYSSDGFYHFNWGWGGLSDGYFLLDALNPGSLGIGANGGGYNFGQEIVRGVQPETGEEYPPYFVQVGNMEGKMSGITFTLTAGENGGWFNLDTKPITIDLATKVQPVAPATGETIYTECKDYTNKTLQVSYGWGKLDLSMPRSLSNGTYRLTLCYRLSGTQTWMPVLCAPDCFNYVEFTKEGNKYTITENKAAVPEIEDAGLLTPLYYGQAARMSITVTNPSGKELTGYFYPALFKGGKPVMKADGEVITLAPGEEATREFECTFELLSGNAAPTEATEYQLCFYDPASEENTDSYLKVYDGFSKTVTMSLPAGVDGIVADESIVYDKAMSLLICKENVTEVTLTAMSGIVFDRTAESAGGTVSLATLPAGIYIVKARLIDGSLKTLKISVNY